MPNPAKIAAMWIMSDAEKANTDCTTTAVGPRLRSHLPGRLNRRAQPKKLKIHRPRPRKVTPSHSASVAVAANPIVRRPPACFSKRSPPLIISARTRVTAAAGTISHSFTASAGSRRVRGLPMISATPVKARMTNEHKIHGR
jgi:hypothetical protein